MVLLLFPKDTLLKKTSWEKELMFWRYISYPPQMICESWDFRSRNWSRRIPHSGVKQNLFKDFQGICFEFLKPTFQPSCHSMFRLYIFLPNTWKIWEIEENAISYKVDKKSPNLWIICLYVALCCESMLFSFFRTSSHGFCGISLSSTRRTPNLLTCSTALKKVKSTKLSSDTHT